MMFSSVSKASARFYGYAAVCAGILALALVAPPAAIGQDRVVPPATPKHAIPHRPGAHARKAALQSDPAPTPPPPAPEPPKWPANEAPAPPAVTWDSQGLRIEASNSSLHQIMDEVATRTGAKVEGLGTDERVFGEYGPGPARDVLSQLLHGSNYNVLMLGDQGQGTPREIVLSARTKGSAHPGNAQQPQSQSVQQDDDQVEPEPEEPIAPPPAIVRPPMGQQMNQPGQPMTPQQRLEEMQRQQMQLMQQNLQQQNPPPQ